MRFYDVDKGSITIDGKDIRDISRKNLRSFYGMVLQETWLRNTTVRENIAFGKPDATDEEIENAAKASYAHNFIKRLPKEDMCSNRVRQAVFHRDRNSYCV